MRAPLFLLVCLLVSAGLPVKADYGEDDAPDRVSEALDVPFGVFNGTVGGADRADAYRVVPSPGKGVIVHLYASSSVRLTLYDDAGTFVTRGQFVPLLNHSSTNAVAAVGPVRILVEGPGSAGPSGNVSYPYRLEVLEGDVSNLAITSFNVTPRWGSISFLVSGAQPEALVTLTLTATHGLPWTGEVEVWARDSLNRPPFLPFLQVTLTIPAGQTVVLSQEWDHVGVGTVEVVARVKSPRDANPLDDVRRQSYDLYETPLPVGVALL